MSNETIENVLARTSPEQLGAALEEWAAADVIRHAKMMEEIKPKYRAMGFTFQERW